MLFPYTYVPNAMEKMQEFIDFIFFEVWCKAPIGLTFSPDLFKEEPDLRGILSHFGFAAKAPERGKQFYKDIKSIYELFAGLTPPQIDQFKQWYQANNDIKKACENNPAIHIARYKEVVSVYPVIGKQLASFFRGLYDGAFLNLAEIRNKVGDIKDHNHQFFTINNVGKCPFCGISDLKGIHHTRREAYDHYLPKYRYPFNSINFRNLAPACHECNSTYKLSKDPARNAVGRRKSFYPYADPGHTIVVTIDLSKPDVDHLTPDDIQLDFGPTVLEEEIETWKDVYGIEERYKAKCCSETDGKYWLAQVLDEWKEDGRSPDEYMKTLSRSTAKNPFAESNFLKKAFLEGCERVGLFSA